MITTLLNHILSHVPYELKLQMKLDLELDKAVNQLDVEDYDFELIESSYNGNSSIRLLFNNRN